MLSTSLKKSNIRRPSGIIAGLTATWAIFGLFLAVDSQLNVPPSTFYKTIGIVFGVNSTYAMYVGFLLFMVTAVIISMIYNYVSEHVPCPNTTLVQSSQLVFSRILIYIYHFLIQ